MGVNLIPVKWLGGARESTGVELTAPAGTGGSTQDLWESGRGRVQFIFQRLARAVYFRTNIIDVQSRFIYFKIQIKVFA